MAAARRPGPGRRGRLARSAPRAVRSQGRAEPAAGSHIFWLANSAFSVTGASPPAIFGTIIANTTASFANGLVVHGRVFAQTGAVTFGGSTTAVVEGLVNACPPLG